MVQNSQPLKFLNKVGKFVATDPKTQLVMFTGVFNSQTNINITMSAQDTKGGTGNALLMREYTDRQVEVALTTKNWDLKYLAASVGSKIACGLREIYDIETAVEINESGIGTLPKTAVGMVHVRLNNGGEVDVAASELNTIDLSKYNIKGQCVKATYRFSSKSNSVTITADAAPLIVDLSLQSGVTDTMVGYCGDVLVHVPSFALDGNVSINTSAEGATAEMELKGVALAVDGSDCKEGMIYAYVVETSDSFVQPAVIGIIASPSPVELRLSPTPETETISVIGECGAMYEEIGILNSECTYVTDDPAIATVDANGIITAVSAGTATITVTHTGTKLTDEVEVTVI